MSDRRMTITIADGIDDAEALEAVLPVVGLGRISGVEDDTYCYLTFMHNDHDHRLAVYAWRTRAGNDAFRVAIDRGLR